MESTKVVQQMKRTGIQITGFTTIFTDLFNYNS
jgi:hypothetical protein